MGEVTGLITFLLMSREWSNVVIWVLEGEGFGVLCFVFSGEGAAEVAVDATIPRTFKDSDRPESLANHRRPS